MAKNETRVDELDTLLGGGNGDDLEGFDGVNLDEVGGVAAPNPEDEINLESLDLSNVIEKDFRPLTEGQEYNSVIVGAKGGRSGAGNLQVIFTHQVIDCLETDSEGRSLDGVTVDDYAGVDPQQPQQHWKIKVYGKLCGKLNANGTLTTNKPRAFLGDKMRFQAKIDAEYNPAEPRNKIGRVCAYKPPVD